MFELNVYCLDNEIWKDIPGYEGEYQASTMGRIRTVNGKITYTERHGKRTWKGRIMKGRGNNKITGFRVSLFKNGKPKDFLVARLVCITFLGFPSDLKNTVNHKDGNRFNNHIDNLEWLSLADNIRHGFENGLYRKDNTTLIVDGEKVCFKSKSEASAFLGRNKGYISNCLHKGKNKIVSEGKFIEICF